VWPDIKTFLFLLLNGFLGSMVSDVLWALAVVMTSPFAASVGLALTIPLGWIADFIFHKNSAFIHLLYIYCFCLPLDCYFHGAATDNATTIKQAMGLAARFWCRQFSLISHFHPVPY
jgi:hypothetical protein